MKKLVAALLALGGSTVLPSCLTRDVVEQEPSTSNIFVSRQQSSGIDKIDLLFVVDNSASMADKQAIFEQAVPRMLERLVEPDCVQVDPSGSVTARAASIPSATAGGEPTCPDAMVLEFRPVADIHIGVISSSLGGHGSTACAGAENDDRALLLPKVRPGLVDPHQTGFLVWRPVGGPGQPIEGDLARLSEHFRAHIVSAGEKGCGYEAPLEAFYRFLIDPAPPLQVTVSGTKSAPQGVDDQVLEQRAAFLRPDSLVAVVMLTDENDCSIMDGIKGYTNSNLGWALAETTNAFPGAGAGAGEQRQFPVATSYCHDNPNHACCFSCFRDTLPNGCTDGAALAECASPGAPRLSAEQDRANTRCFDNKRRFGVDLLYPVERYIDGLQNTTVPHPTTEEMVPNPLLLGVDGKTPRPRGLVFLGGITGVPWQDIATAESLTDETQLSYLTASALKQPFTSPHTSQTFTRWELIAGVNPASEGSRSCDDDTNCGLAPTLPLDPFMVQSIVPRSGVNPITGQSTTLSPTWNPINGHEQDPSLPYESVGGFDALPANDDLQYSCTFPLEPYGGVKVDCAPGDSSCDCGHGPLRDRSLCKTGPSAPATTIQSYGKAYPSGRVLQVLEGAGENAVVASICPKIHDPSSADYGYNPAISAIVDLLAITLKGQCLPRPLGLDEEGKVPCVVVEALHPRDGTLGCEADGRGGVDEKVKKAIVDELEESKFCIADECDSLTMCAIDQLVGGEAREECLNGPLGSEPNQAAGYCYVDPAQGLGSEQLVASCRPSERQLLRFVGPETPTKNTAVVVACTGELPSKNEIPAPAEE